MNEYWEEGYEAFDLGSSLDECPYGDFSDEGIEWGMGWECAEADAGESR